MSCHSAMTKKSPNSVHQSPLNHRQLRVGELLRHALSDILARGDLRDPEVFERSITIAEIRITRDLRTATAYVSLFGGGDLQRVISGLNRAAPYLSGQVTRMVGLRNAPKICFLADPTLEQAGQIETLLRQPRVRRDLDGTKKVDPD